MKPTTNILCRRKALGWSRRKLARESGVCNATIQRLENNNDARPDAVMRLEAVLRYAQPNKRGSK